MTGTRVSAPAQLAMTGHPWTSHNPWKTHRKGKNYSVDHVQHEYRHPDGGAPDDYRVGADMKGPLVLALVVIDQSR